jgi:hypothetical protein
MKPIANTVIGQVKLYRKSVTQTGKMYLLHHIFQIISNTFTYISMYLK